MRGQVRPRWRGIVGWIGRGVKFLKGKGTMLQEQTVVTSSAMTGYRTGAPTRRKILEALLQREPRTMRGLATDIGVDYQVVSHHIGVMERAALVTVQRRRGRLGSIIYLTEAGRTAARTI